MWKNFVSYLGIILMIFIHSLTTHSQDNSRTEWYKNAIYNIHFGPCPSTFTAAKASDYKDQIRELIRRTGATMLQFHAGSQHGYTNYPSKVGITNPNLDGVDIIRIWRDVTKEMGVKFFAYMSYAHSKAEGEAHPEFCQVNSKGERSEFLCTNNPYADTYILPKVKEIIETYDVDGFWFDASIWAVQACYCAYCVKGFGEKYGQDPPKEKTDPLWQAFGEYEREAFERTSKRVGDVIHQLKPSCIYSPNYAFSIYQPEPVRDYADVISGDVGGIRRAQMVSFKCRFSDTQGVPWDIFVGSHFIGSPPSTQRFFLPKSPDYLNQENAIIRANGGIASVWATTWWDASLSPHYTELLGQAADFIRERLDVFQGTEPIRDVGILHSASTFYREGDGFCHINPAMDRLEGAHIALTQNNYHVNVFADYELDRRLKQYRIVVLSQQTYLSPGVAESIKNYVRDGGSIVVAGKAAMIEDVSAGLKSSLEDVLGIQFLNVEPMESAYIPWNDFPMQITCQWYPVVTTTAEKVHPLWRDWNERHPIELPYPAMTVNKYGNGTAVYIAGDLFTAYCQNNFHGIRDIIEKAMVLANNSKIIESDAPIAIEFSLRKKAEDMIVHMVNRSVDWDMDSRGAVHVEHIPLVGPFQLKVRCERKPANVVLRPSKANIDWSWNDGFIWATIPGIHIHEALVINRYFTQQ